MSNVSNHSGSTPSTGRGYLWLGLAVTILGIATYVGLLSGAQLLHTPWYAPVLAVAGVALTFMAARRKPGMWRYAALVFCCLLAAGECWFLLSYTKLPAYAGPVVAGQPFPEFTTKLANNTEFSNKDMVGPQNTALIYYRGHW